MKTTFAPLVYIRAIASVMVAFISGNNVAVMAFVSWLLPSSEATCLETDCQLDSWSIKGCDQYGMREMRQRKCDGGVIYSCCDVGQDPGAVDPNPALPLSDSCWDTACQLYSWPVRGCEQYSQVMAKSQSCLGGTIYTCCEPLDNRTPNPPIGGTAGTGCGVISAATPFILNGFGTTRGRWPWHVALYHKDGDKSVYGCGATLMSRNKVITAAHCVTSGEGMKLDPSTVELRFGKHTLSADENGSQTRQVKSIAIPSAYNHTSFFADLAVLTLSENVEFSGYVRPACLFEPDTGITSIVGKVGTVVGWGLNEYNNQADSLQTAKLPVVSMKVCVNSHPDFFSKYTTDGNFCAGFRNGTSPCQGDSGGGMVLNRNAIWYLRGVVSFSVKGNSCSPEDGNFYVVFTDLSRFPNFIQKNL